MGCLIPMLWSELVNWQVTTSAGHKTGVTRTGILRACSSTTNKGASKAWERQHGCVRAHSSFGYIIRLDRSSWGMDWYLYTIGWAGWRF
ncbi:hypothetical protein VTJ04DRAFT_10541 [Mycothermus thermophilus]|uniref:uncharacterized protein n=1 Tax=Humicola insolens TaxID=85995 RepID=UPI0037426546